MSKSKGNVINPDDVVKEYGADCLRMYEMFMGPFADNKPWSSSSIKGVYRFLNKVWAMLEEVSRNDNKNGSNPKIETELNELVRSIDDKIERLQFNTCVSDFMKFLNEFSEEVFKYDLKVFLKLIFPFAPVIASEGLEILGEADFLEKYYNYDIIWPKFDPSKQVKDTFKIKVMIANKFRGDFESASSPTEAQILEEIKKDPNFNKFLPEKISKVVFVPGKVLNII
jgi:leucyl-tRNA synthetase